MMLVGETLSRVRVVLRIFYYYFPVVFDNAAVLSSRHVGHSRPLPMLPKVPAILKNHTWITKTTNFANVLKGP